MRDPLGNLYGIQTRVEGVSPQELERRLGEPEFTRSMEYVQSADSFPGRVSGLGWRRAGVLPAGRGPGAAVKCSA
ncbi:hypothetical protein [Streptomyces sp. KMM 9044]|uniref:hypothetical protein n=1 Tax=Streptomyces sp. KMM 9044 TaxID=2744474 RepID=UPI002150ACE1|nr:hypothetical protein [Streptomyces sp. KMM 9044]WAX78442.1 hypothetical protein HUV60_012910 [Streptomyces sp. KMM 9044]